MTMSKLLFRSLIISILVLSCSREKNKEADSIEEKEEQVSNKESVFIDIILNNDSSNHEMLEGHFQYYFEVNDTLNISNKDKRRVFLAIGIKPENDLEFKNNEDDFFMKTLDFKLKQNNDTLIIPFNLTKQFKGEAIIYGIIQENFVLNLYTDDSEKVRMLSYDIPFETNIYVK